MATHLVGDWWNWEAGTHSESSTGGGSAADVRVPPEARPKSSSATELPHLR